MNIGIGLVLPELVRHPFSGKRLVFAKYCPSWRACGWKWGLRSVTMAPVRSVKKWECKKSRETELEAIHGRCDHCRHVEGALRLGLRTLEQLHHYTFWGVRLKLYTEVLQSQRLVCDKTHIHCLLSSSSVTSIPLLVTITRSSAGVELFWILDKEFQDAPGLA